GRLYISKKEAHVVNDRDSGHHTTGCTFHVNAYRRKKDNLIYVSKIDSQHNHALVDNINMVAPHYRKFTSEMIDEVKFLASCGSIRCKKEEISDAGSLYLKLIKKQQADPTFHIDAQFEGKDNHLTRLCWMSPGQQQLWARFHDVVLLDSTAKTNRHSMILCIMILVDNHNCSRLTAAAIVSDETKETYEWLFK
ncbi:5572_t:CDS:2, partial [Cetraspora pellucida]